MLDALQERGWTLIDGVARRRDAEALLRPLGRLMVQERGSPRYRVKAMADESHLSSSRGNQRLHPHTEASYLPIPPRYVALWCLWPAACGGGRTLLADGRTVAARVRDRISAESLAEPLEFSNWPDGRRCRAPILSNDPGQPLIRFSYNYLARGHYHPPDEGAPFGETASQHLAEEVACAFHEQSFGLRLTKFSLLVWDNFLFLHAREGFRDHRRLLLRYWISDEVD
jgi:alpha-ketoglutarate-dependent taurine dioxygenase